MSVFIPVAVSAVFAVFGVAWARANMRAEERTLTRVLVPAADDSRWIIESDFIVTCGPYKINASCALAWLYIYGEQVESADRDATMRRFKNILRAQQRRYISPEDVQRRKEKQQIAQAQAWHKENEPKLLDSTSDEHRKGVYR